MHVFLSYPELTVLRAGRKTDDGFAIFKEDELGINPEVGGERVGHTPTIPDHS